MNEDTEENELVCIYLGQVYCFGVFCTGLYLREIKTKKVSTLYTYSTCDDETEKLQ
jgi:hypothetical protein